MLEKSFNGHYVKFKIKFRISALQKKEKVKTPLQKTRLSS